MKPNSNSNSRRTFLKQASLGAALTVARPKVWANSPKSSLNVLVLGGTNFLGPAIVNDLLSKGHKVTLFNRGITNPDLYNDLPRIVGDRSKGLAGYEKLKSNNKKWDLVVDVWPDNSNYVGEAIQVLKSKAEHYSFVSSIAVYTNYRNPGMDETTPLIEATEYQEGYYSENKVLCENLVRENFPDRHTIVRPGAIVGDRDPGPFGVHLLSRLATQKEVVAPDSNDPVQFIDAADIGAFLTFSAENEIYGAYNLVGPEEPMGYKDFIMASKKALKSDAKIIWVDPDFLMNDMKVEPFSEIPFWIPIKNDPEPGFYQIGNQKAINAGLKFTDFSKTVAVSYDSVIKERYISEPESEDYFGIKQQKEQAVLKAWRERG